MQKRTLTSNDVGSLLFLAALIFGAWLRLSAAWMAGFPVNDGGLFYRMILDLQANHYIPPLYTTYNNINIPFAYPPLTFYIGAVLSDFLHVSPLVIIRWVPGIVNTVCIFAFYHLAKEILDDALKSGLAALVFAVTPHMATWLSMGGGLTRSFGTLFMMLTILQAYRLFSNKGNSNSNIFWAIIFGGLTLLSHTESSVFAVIIPIYIWWMKSRSLKGFVQGGVVALGVLLLAGTWFGFVIYHHGIDPFISATQTGGHSLSSILKLLNFDVITQEKYLGVLGVLGLLGLIYLVVRREYFIPLLFVLMYIIQPRSAHTVGNIPLAMATAVLIVDALLPAMTNSKNTSSLSRVAKIFVVCLVPYLLINALYLSYMLAQNHVTNDELAAMTWAKENTPADSRFLLLTGESESMCDAAAEWFPALSERTSVATLQGREWTLSNQFGSFLSHRNSIQICIDADIGCLEQESEYFGQPVEYIFISWERTIDNCSIPITPHPTRAIIISLKNSEKYELAYENETTVIFQVKQSIR
jgi:hypothetical protein